MRRPKPSMALLGTVVALDVAAVLAAQILYPPGLFDLSAAVLFTGAVTSFSAAGALLAHRVPRNVIGWLFLMAASLLAVGVFAGAYAYASLETGSGTWPGTGLLAMLNNVLFIPPIVIVAAGVPAVFPDGRLPSSRWRWLAVLLIGGTVAATLKPAFTPGAVSPETPVDNPLGVPGLGALLDLVSAAAAATALPAFVGSVGAVATRYVRGGEVEREQLKWLIAVASVSAIAFPIAFLVPNSTIAVVAWYVGFGALIALPSAIGIAILRYRLYEIDRIISRSLAWGSLTAMLVAVYVAAVVVLGGVFGGVTQGDTFAVAGSTLLAAALFQPLRVRLQRAMDRRFDRARYDARRVADEFSTHLRDQVDLAALTGELDRVAHETVRPSSVAMWLRYRVPDSSGTRVS